MVVMNAPVTENVPQSSRVEGLTDIPAAALDEAATYADGIEAIQDGNVMYQRCFQILKLGQLEAEMPRLVVFGQQSMGKTTLLDLIMGGPIGYSSTDTGTKQPVVIVLKPTEDACTDPNQIKCTLKGRTVEIRDLQKEMHKIMSTTKGILSDELDLEIAMPQSVHAVFVDLPGIKDDSAEGAHLTRSVVRHYVQNNPNDLYILVKKASDDPANWPHSLREFILSEHPAGLGLKPKQTVVVGTRAKDFLIGEANDVRTLSDLKTRVDKRAVKDCQGNLLPLYLLELFSLNLEDRERCDFPARKAKMDFQVEEGRRACHEILRKSFIEDRVKVTDLEKIFDTDNFSRELNQKFQDLLSEQLALLDQRLIRKYKDLKETIRAKELKLANQGTVTVRESIYAFVSSLGRLVTSLVMGDFEVMRLDNGDKWLQENGGTLSDNLRDGHALALELWDEKRYNPDFLDRMMELSERAASEMEAHQGRWRRRPALSAKDRKTQLEEDKRRQEQARAAREESGNSTSSSRPTVIMASPDLSGDLQTGQYVRHAAKDGTHIFGIFSHFTTNEESASVTFVWQQAPGATRDIQRELDVSKLCVLLPVSLVINANVEHKPFLAWYEQFDPDSWKRVKPVIVMEVMDLQASENPWRRANGPVLDSNVYFTGRAKICRITDKHTRNFIKAMRNRRFDLNSESSPFEGWQNQELEEVLLTELYLDAEAVECDTKVPALQKVAGDHAEKKLLNQFCLTYIGRWMKFNVAHLEPDRRLTENVLLQMMRSSRHVIDSAGWISTVADLLQANVSQGILQLARLAASATGVSLLRILRAAFNQFLQQADANKMNQSFAFLLKSPRFISECDAALEGYCRERVLLCAKEMAQDIFDQSQAIHFEMISDIFEGCRRFESEFLGTDSLSKIIKDINQKLEARKNELSKADVYAQGSEAMLSQDMIYEEVRVHFWVLKLLLATPLTTRLYVAFYKDVKDRSQHLGAEDPIQSDYSSLESALHRAFLFEIDSEGSSQRTEDSLTSYYQFSFGTKRLQEEINEMKRAQVYLKHARDCVIRLQTLMKNGHGVDFLEKLGNVTSALTPAAPFNQSGPVNSTYRPPALDSSSTVGSAYRASSLHATKTGTFAPVSSRLSTGSSTTHPWDTAL